MRNALATQLQDLRVRAGGPSIRTIERLIARQGRQDGMARSTIQEKLSGRSPLNLSQVLSLVEAFTENARLIGSPLLPQEVDRNIWRERVAANQKISRQENAAIFPSAPHPDANIVKWNLTALKRSGMTDLLELILQSQDMRTADWLPHVVAEMMRAQMSCEAFMKTAASEAPQEVVNTLASLSQKFPIETTPNAWGNWPSTTQGKPGAILTLIQYAARVHGAENAPVISVGLRRADVGEYVSDFLSAIACWHLAPQIERAVDSLREAELAADAESTLLYTGSHRLLNRTFEIVTYFDSSGAIEDRDLILKGMAKNPRRMISAMRDTENEEDREEMQDVLLSAIPWGRKPQYVKALEGAGFNDLAERVSASPENPPF